MIAIWLVSGLVLALPFIFVSYSSDQRQLTHFMGRILLVAATIYIGFSIAWGNHHWWFIETLGVGIYGLFYWLATKRSLIWLSAGWLLHPVWDIALHLFGPGSHIVPQWYAYLCVSFDITLAIYIAFKHKEFELRGNIK